ncbi:hypothetical protein D8T52_16715 [Vibrio vulnificus]|uniref:hypothetical protein n=1 Tax=Vibrio vulnificus TaxID=672 RepID=UPI001029533C|nr:hypothetical protein [Vibrio vulnificus]RZP74392.1 hypothetical protein D8T52_16715 [Vibrio vulnificus]
MTIEVGRYLGQDGVWLKNSKTRLFVQQFGGMTPDFSRRITIDECEQWVNTHWNPHFKAPFSGKLDAQSEEQAAYWGIELMRQAAGTFPCAPTFGPGNEQLLPHGDTANHDWQLEQAKLSDDGVACVQWSLVGSYKGLRYQKWDLLRASDSAHYMVLEISNPGSVPVQANMAWHTTLGALFLERGCYIASNCHKYKVAPAGTEFDTTSRLAADAEFTCLSAAPGKSGRDRDLSLMPGYNGCAEFVSGVTHHTDYLWSVCANPYLNLAYLSLIPFSALEGQVNASSMNYWIHTGGREFAPWADYDGGSDRNYALGMECAVGASCLGLDESTQLDNYMGKPAHHTIGVGETVCFPCINSLFDLDPELFADGLSAEATRLRLHQAVEAHIATLDLNFSAFKALHKHKKDD